MFHSLILFYFFQFNNIIQETDSNSPTKCPMTTQLILERDKETEEPIIEVNKKLVRKLKPHQVEGINCGAFRISKR